MIRRYIVMFWFLVGMVLYTFTYAEEYTDITKTKQYKEYEDFARNLKKQTNKNFQFDKEEIRQNTTNIDTLLNTSIPNWKELNTNKPQSISSQYTQENNSIPLIFISFSMSEELIKNYIAEAKLYGGVLVLRGLINNSLKQTVTKLQEIEGIADKIDKDTKSNLSIIIHPHLFKLYDVKQVPAIVISKDNAGCILKYDDCSALYEYDKIYGSVTIEYALEEVKRSGIPSIKPIATKILSKKKSV